MKDKREKVKQGKSREKRNKVTTISHCGKD